jgi:hypothetical protein
MVKKVKKVNYGTKKNPGGGEIFRTRSDRPRGTRSLLYNGYRVLPGGKAAGAWCKSVTNGYQVCSKVVSSKCNVNRLICEYVCFCEFF